jgi:UTP--glucose-1-phosphate uridylyltransferase
LQPQIFDRIAAQHPGTGGEIQLTDAMIQLMAEERFFGLKFEGKTYDCGDRVGWLAANVAYGLAREDLGPAFRQVLKEIVDGFGGL